MVSRDGAKTWTQVAEAEGEMLAFALSPDGSKVAFGGPIDGVWMASAADPKPAKVSSIGARCLTWTTQGLFLCGTEYPDGFTVGISNDEAKTFKPLYQLSNISELECGATTTTGSLCPAEWPKVQATIGTPIEETGPQPVDSGQPKPPTTPAPENKSCGCGLAGPDGAWLGPGVVALAFIFGALRRKR
jgi:hypothetical protein